jgi:hypothetical protein
VKDSSVPNPSLAKVVKNSTPTILFQFEISFRSKLRKQDAVWGLLCKTWAHCLGKKSSLGTEDTRSGGDLTSEVFVISKVPFHINPGRLYFAYLFIIVPRRIYGRRAHL